MARDDPMLHGTLRQAAIRATIMMMMAAHVRRREMQRPHDGLCGSSSQREQVHTGGCYAAAGQHEGQARRRRIELSDGMAGLRRAGPAVATGAGANRTAPAAHARNMCNELAR